MPLTDDFIPRERFGQEFRGDIQVYVCRQCMTVQTQHNVDMGDYYEDYQYAVGASPKASRFMRVLAENLLAKFRPGAKGMKVRSVEATSTVQKLTPVNVKPVRPDFVVPKLGVLMMRLDALRGVPVYEVPKLNLGYMGYTRHNCHPLT